MTDAPAIIQNANGIWMLEGEQLWDTTILPVCLEHIKEGDTVIDAGAWIGGHAMAYAEKVWASGKVIAFEPNPTAYDCLVLNTREAGNVERYNVALGDDSKWVSFSVKKGWYDSAYVSGHDQESNRVEMRPMDIYKLAPNFIKMDVEGCELKVLKGAEKTITNHKPKMILEINKDALARQGSIDQDIYDWLKNHRYGFRVIWAGNPNPALFNIIAVPE